MSAAVMERGIGGSGKPPAPSLDIIMRVVADDFGLTPRDLVRMNRAVPRPLARQTAMWLARRLTKLSFPRIGMGFGDRDHTTVMYACSRIDELMQLDVDLSERVVRLLSALAEGMAAETSPPAPVVLKPQSPSIDTIIRIVAGTFQVSQRDIVSDRQDETTLLARYTCMWLSRRLTGASLTAIGLRFNRRRRSVTNGIERIDTMMEGDAGIGQVVLGLIDCLTLPPVAA